MTKAYPLKWPAGFPRTKTRVGGKFQASLAGALKNVHSSLRLFAKDSDREAKNIIISSNVTLGEQNPSDPGVSIWFTWDDLQVCIPVDRYSRVEGNLQAIHHIIEARRTEVRHGGLHIVRATFSGFKALPAPADWRMVLGPVRTLDEAETSYRDKAKARHPDKPGGSDSKMAELNQAIGAARLEFKP